MSRLNNLIINDHLFQQAISCPLKLYFNLTNQSKENRSVNFRRQNKLLLRDVISHQYPNTRYTDNDVETALRETQDYLKKEEITICGAVVRAGDFLTRIPILHKKGDALTITQIHGKLLKDSNLTLLGNGNKSKSAVRYLLKAMYRMEVVKRAYSEFRVQTDFIFPLKRYRSERPNLFKNTMCKESLSQKSISELNRLFVTICGTDEVIEISDNIYSDQVHSHFRNCSIEEAFKKVHRLLYNPLSAKPKRVHSGCKTCQYRVTNRQNENGCWTRFFADSTIKITGKHIYELVGQVTDEPDSLKGYFQENIKLSPGFETSGMITDIPGGKITMQQRQALQILDARDEVVPRIWCKPTVQSVANLNYPLHFIDFEAATHALPMTIGAGAYDPIYFQFSCHTLYEDGSVIHNEWLDISADSNPHKGFLEAFLSINDISKGTFVQYSPFEKQALFRLLRETEINSELSQFCAPLKVLLHKNGQRRDFFDLSRTIRDGYYNCKLEGGLSLKETLNSILNIEMDTGKRSAMDYDFGGKRVDFYKPDPLGGVLNPYDQLMDDSVLNIGDGESAMHAYISLKAGAIDSETEETLIKLLKRYCTLDSYAMIIITNHLKKVAKQGDEKGEVLVYEKN